MKTVTKPKGLTFTAEEMRANLEYERTENVLLR